MLNPQWSKLDWKKDLGLWEKLVDLINDEFRYMPGSFFETYERQINHLYSNYYRTKAGGNPDPNRATRQKFQIMQKDRLFEELEYEANLAEQEKVNQWNEQQLKDEAPEDRRIREDEMRKNLEASIRISKRQREG